MLNGEKNQKIVNLLLLVSYLICFIRLMTLKHQIGLIGVGIFAAAFLLLFAFMLFMRYGVANVVTRIINKKMADGEYKNAGKYLFAGVFVGAIISLLFTLINLIGASAIAEGILHTNLDTDVLIYIAPSFLFVGVSEILSSYLIGSGDGINDSLIKLFRELLISLLCFLFAGMFLSYGVKVGNLLKADSYTSVYGARGCALGVTVGSFITLLINIFFYLQKKVNLRRLIRRDQNERDTEIASAIIELFKRGFVILTTAALLSVSIIVITSVSLGAAQNYLNSVEESQFISFLEIFGGIMAYVAPFLFVFAGFIYSIAYAYENDWKILIKNEEIEELRNDVGRKIRGYLIKGLAVLGALFALRAPIIGLLGADYAKEFSLSAGFLICGTFFFGLYTIISRYFIAADKKLFSIILTALLFVMICILSALTSGGNPILIIGITYFFSFMIIAIVSFILLVLSGHFSLNFTVYIKCIMGAVVPSGLVFLISSLMFEKTSNVLILVIGLVTYVAVYMILMTAIHGFSKRELSRIPFGASLKRLFYNRY